MYYEKMPQWYTYNDMIIDGAHTAVTPLHSAISAVAAGPSFISVSSTFDQKNKIKINNNGFKKSRKCLKKHIKRI